MISLGTTVYERNALKGDLEFTSTNYRLKLPDKLNIN